MPHVIYKGDIIGQAEDRDSAFKTFVDHCVEENRDGVEWTNGTQLNVRCVEKQAEKDIGKRQLAFTAEEIHGGFQIIWCDV